MTAEPVGQRKGEKRVRRFCGTLNNYTNEDYEAMKNYLNEHAQYAIIGKEVGKSGTKHLQFYFRTKSPACASAVRKWPGFKKTALFYCKGTEKQNKDYCSKEDDYTEIHPENFKEVEGAGAKFEEICQQVLKGGEAALQKVIDEHPGTFVRSYRGLRELVSARAPQRDLEEPPKCVYAFGEPGSGKSTLIHKMAKEEAKATNEQIYYMGSSFPWFDGYTGEKIVVIDDIRDRDFKGQPVSLNFMTKMIDRFANKVQIKGGSTNLLAHSFYLSSVLHPADMWNRDAHDPVDQFLRRITDLYECKLVNDEHQSVRLGNGRTPRTLLNGTNAAATNA